MTTIWPTPSTYPVAFDNFTPALIDNVDEVIANHPNSLADALMNTQQKLGLDNELISDSGGIQFSSVGYIAPPTAPPIPSLWMDVSAGPAVGYPPKYTDQLGVTYDLRYAISAGFVGFGYNHVGLSVGDLVYVSAPDTVALADAVVGNEARGMIINVVGAICDVAYGSEVASALWALTPGLTYYLSTAGGFATAPPPGATITQELGFARNATTLVFRPTIVSR